jgi:DNA-binding NarL/FixJ family response regulator
MISYRAPSNAAAHPGSRAAGARSESARGRQRRRLHVLIGDEQGMIRDALCALLGAMPEVTRVSAEQTGPELLRSAASLRPDLVIIEFPRPLEGGAALIAVLKRQQPDLRVMVLTFHPDAHLVDAAMRAGADAYLLKRDTMVELSNALGSVLAGKTYLSPGLAGRVVRGVWHAGLPDEPQKQAGSELTYRELQVIRLIAQGHRTREIAQLLSLSHKTIEKHRASIMRKLGLRNASAVAAYATTHGLA